MILKFFVFLTFVFMPFSSIHSAQQALERLITGNNRYISDRLHHPNRTSESRAATAKGQSPFAVILGCSDSRVAPEIVFDQGIGDLFVVRVAGNVAGKLEQESIRFAVEHLGSVIVVVLGHVGCGAIHAFIQGKTQDIPKIAEMIKPALQGRDLTLNLAVQANAVYVKDQLKKAPL